VCLEDGDFAVWGFFQPSLSTTAVFDRKKDRVAEVWMRRAARLAGRGPRLTFAALT
jgi:hypothetical protein